MFGFFKNKKGKMLIAETSRVIDNAQKNLSVKTKQIIAKNVIKKMLIYVKEIENIPKNTNELDVLLKIQCNEATQNRQNEITIDEENNPKWVEAALIESCAQANSGYFGKKAEFEVMEMIDLWCKENMAQKDIDAFEKKNIFI
jgi:hypothetical protein